MEKEILTQINRTVLAVLLRALRVLYREDSRIRTEIDSWPEGLTLKLKCGPGGAVLALQKSGTYGIRRLRAAQHTDITMNFKSVQGAFRVLSGQVGI